MQRSAAQMFLQGPQAGVALKWPVLTEIQRFLVLVQTSKYLGALSELCCPAALGCGDY